MIITSFAPVENKNAVILILGSMPGKKSLELNQYYAHKQNAFWYIMEAIFKIDSSLSYKDRVWALKESKVALWDVLKHCEREGSLDSSIKIATEVPNEFETFLIEHPNINHIFFNGKKAEKSFRKHIWPKLQKETKSRLDLLSLPSSSPAHAAKSRKQKITEWQNQLISVLN